MARDELTRRFGENVVRTRRLADLSQDELGSFTSLNRIEISSIERGERSPRRRHDREALRGPRSDS